MRRTVARSGGAALVLGVIFALFSVASFDISDPSLSTATARDAVSNVGGAMGAMISDALLQALGGASIPVLLVLLLWGADAALFATPEKTPLSSWLKAGGLVAVLFVLGGAMAAWPRPADWPFIVGVGGLFGDMAMGFVEGALVSISLPFPRMVSAVLFSAGAIFLLGFCGGVRIVHLAAALDAVIFSWQTGLNLLSKRLMVH